MTHKLSRSTYVRTRLRRGNTGGGCGRGARSVPLAAPFRSSRRANKCTSREVQRPDRAMPGAGGTPHTDATKTTKATRGGGKVTKCRTPRRNLVVADHSLKRAAADIDVSLESSSSYAPFLPVDEGERVRERGNTCSIYLDHSKKESPSGGVAERSRPRVSLFLRRPIAKRPFLAVFPLPSTICLGLSCQGRRKRREAAFPAVADFTLDKAHWI